MYFVPKRGMGLLIVTRAFHKAVKTMKTIRDSDGSIVLEATLTLPFFALFLLGAISLLQVAAADLALRSAVSETAKTIASYMYPVGLLYTEGKAKVESGKPAQVWNGITGRVEEARDQVQRIERFVDDYAAYIPEPLLRLAEGEKLLRETVENDSAEQVDELKRQAAQAIAKTVFTPIVKRFADTKLLNAERLQVVNVDWPVPDDPGRAWIGIEAQYEMKLSFPFFTKTIILKKRALERCWVGG